MDGEGNKIQVMLSAASVGAESLAAYADLGDHPSSTAALLGAARSVDLRDPQVSRLEAAAYDAAPTALPAPTPPGPFLHAAPPAQDLDH